ncbi:Rieske (2Fe-2S) protein [Pseudothauera nasutitermitis]|uniref:Rieske (2Fe-2S) protein n=1 Tax=Pseudothauera nasutitermitis TaxID=2565930 RepID=A0A4V3WCH2_9RHOO|nr:Rieske 2Fe-2S domain-containing protein [Pseudothauera nasutitermitis]THF67154.1 Rieske (2Fe-2S) protein [Pseudothauera nasutitermitis]
MAARERLICASADLADGGGGVRFEVTRWGEARAAFAVRYGGKVHAYLNSCAHVPVELDLLPGHFFDLTGHYLVCAAHGAHYRAGDGFCEMGPCKGRSLRALEIVERDGQVFIVEEG